MSDNWRTLNCWLSMTRQTHVCTVHVPIICPIHVSIIFWINFDNSRIVRTLRDNTLMVVHGTSDTRVHVSQTWALTQSLVNYGILFKQMIYPNSGHDLLQVKDHLYQTMEKYFSEVRKGEILAIFNMTLF